MGVFTGELFFLFLREDQAQNLTSSTSVSMKLDVPSSLVHVPSEHAHIQEYFQTCGDRLD